MGNAKNENANYGGQAVIEGVMIRGPQSLAVAVRRTDGRIVVLRRPLVPLTRRFRFLNIPFLRGTFALFDALTTGLRSLSFSADVAMEEENERAALGDAEKGDAETPGRGDAESGGVGEREIPDAGTGGRGDAETWGAGGELVSEAGPVPASPPPPVPASSPPRIETREVASGKGIPLWSLALTMLTTFFIVVVVFVMFPDFLANLLRRQLPPGSASNFLVNFAEGLVRVGLFVAYIAAISRMETIRRVFEYHGAEHQVIYAFENGDPVTPEYAASYDTAHPRCGTSFIGAVVVVSILVFSLLNVDVWYVRQAIKLALLPAVAGVAYEVIRLAGAGRFTFMVAPGLWLQRLTTRRPDRAQVEVAIAALQGALEQEGRSLNRAAEAAGD